jgi:hypothetical protein
MILCYYIHYQIKWSKKYRKYRIVKTKYSTFHIVLGECPCVATEPYNNTITYVHMCYIVTETYNTTITYVQMCVILLWEKIWACTNTLFLPLTSNRVVNLCIYKKEKNVRSTSLLVKGGWDPPNNRITSMLLNKKRKPQTCVRLKIIHMTPNQTNTYYWFQNFTI